MSSNAFVDATAGGVGASVALTLMYPLVVVKTRLQGQKRKTKAEHTGGTPALSPAEHEHWTIVTHKVASVIELILQYETEMMGKDVDILYANDNT